MMAAAVSAETVSFKMISQVVTGDYLYLIVIMLLIN